ncbi:MAG: hypothetical protein CM15mP86_00100 [Gammaproteobacteria bacterium]|nr:MAG: hypothetical protein CM15mP86_00100 [Gammaproteobacteria bacterium]
MQIAYSPEYSKILITAEELDEKIKLAVKDEGEGIPENYKDRVFQRFFRVDKGMSLNQGGTRTWVVHSRTPAFNSIFPVEWKILSLSLLNNLFCSFKVWFFNKFVRFKILFI